MESNNTKQSFAYPLHYRVIGREGDTWHSKKMEILYNPRQEPVDPNNIEALFGVNKTQMCIELFRINGGQPGWYVANLRDRRYYYCGKELSSVTAKFHELGIGKADPMAD
ncbi:MAG: hypothetical protein AAF810_17720 [Cyanobacteria bacterium P01_D01_bin.36]